MISIENIQLSIPNFLINHSQGVKWSPMPTYVDMFLSNDKKYMNWFYDKFKNDFTPLLPEDFRLGSKHGTKGIPIQELLSNEPDDTYYALSHNELSLLPKKYAKPLLEKYKVICIDIMEGRQFITSEISDKLNQFRQDFKVRELIDQMTGPMFGLVTYNNVSKQYNKPEFKYNPKKLAVVPCHKPRPGRLFMLSELHKQELLDNCDWTLFPDFNDKVSTEALIIEGKGDGHFYLSPNLNYKQWPLLTDNTFNDIQVFLNDHKSQLPKSFNNLTNNTFSDSCFSVSMDFLGAHMFNVSCETRDDDCDDKDIFITEKTWKAFLYATPCLVYGSPNVEKKLTGYGFKFPSKSNYDHLQGKARVKAMVDFLRQNHNVQELKDIAEHNFNLAWDRKYLVNLFIEHIKKKQ
jgi:hypothetical protein